MLTADFAGIREYNACWFYFSFFVASLAHTIAKVTLVKPSYAYLATQQSNFSWNNSWKLIGANFFFLLSSDTFEMDKNSITLY